MLPIIDLREVITPHHSQKNLPLYTKPYQKFTERKEKKFLEIGKISSTLRLWKIDSRQWQAYLSFASLYGRDTFTTDQEKEDSRAGNYFDWVSSFPLVVCCNLTEGL